jgi:preprotein translocase subunit SecG
MFTFIVILIALIALLLVVVVLLQSGKGGGLAGIASGGATTQILGARQAPDVLERATWVLASLFIALCILSNFAIDRTEAQESVIQQRAGGAQTEQPVLPPAGAPPTQAPTQPVPEGPATTPDQQETPPAEGQGQ